LSLGERAISTQILLAEREVLALNPITKVPVLFGTAVHLSARK
jgi:hypothetical protein